MYRSRNELWCEHPHLITAISAAIMLDRPQLPGRFASTSTTGPKTRTHRQDRNTDPTEYYQGLS